MFFLASIKAPCLSCLNLKEEVVAFFCFCATGWPHSFEHFIDQCSESEMASRAHDQLLSRSAFDEPYQRIYSSWWSDRCGETESVSSYTGKVVASCSLSVCDWPYQILRGSLLCSLECGQLVNTQTYDPFWFLQFDVDLWLWVLLIPAWKRSAKVGRCRSLVVSCFQGIPNSICSLFYLMWMARPPFHSPTNTVSIGLLQWLVLDGLFLRSWGLRSTFQWLLRRIC